MPRIYSLTLAIQTRLITMRHTYVVPSSSLRINSIFFLQAIQIILANLTGVYPF